MMVDLRIPRRGLIVGFLGAVGMYAMWVGVKDVAFAQAFSARLFGMVLFLVGIVDTFAAGALALRKHWRMTAAILASCATLVVGVYFLLALLSNRDAGPASFIVIVTAVAGSGLSTVWLYRRAKPDLRPFGKAAVGLGGTSLVLLPFLYGIVYGPARRPPLLTIEAAIEPLAPQAAQGHMPQEITITVRNSGSSRVQVLGSLYVVLGVRLSTDAESKVPTAADLEAIFEVPENARFSRFSEESKPALVASGEIVTDGFFFEPNETMTMNSVIQVPADEYDVLRLGVQFVVANRNLLRLADETKLSPATGEPPWVVARWPLQETSYVQDLLRGERLVVVHWYVGMRPGEIPYLVAYIDREDRAQGRRPGEEPYNVKLGELYGLVTYTAEDDAYLAHIPRSRVDPEPE